MLAHQLNFVVGSHEVGLSPTSRVSRHSMDHWTGSWTDFVGTIQEGKGTGTDCAQSNWIRLESEANGTIV
jgi:hypothetical protein